MDENNVFINPSSHEAFLYGGWWDLRPGSPKACLKELRKTAQRICGSVTADAPAEFETFLESQPRDSAYEDFGYWDFRRYFDSKKHGVDLVLQQKWLEYVKGNPCWAGLEGWNEILDSDIVFLFEGKYHISEEELVSAIVNKVLSDYEKVNGTKMSFSTFSLLFPNINTGAEMSYESSDKVKDDSRYRTKIELQDGDYSLYYFWNNNTLHKFITNVNVSLTEYKNY